MVLNGEFRSAAPGSSCLPHENKEAIIMFREANIPFVFADNDEIMKGCK